MDYSVYTQDGIKWTLNGVSPETLEEALINPNARYINLDANTMELRQNIAMIAPVLTEGDTENLYEVFLTNGVAVPAQFEGVLAKVTEQLNVSRMDFVKFGGGYINPNAPRRIVKAGAIQQQ